MIPKSRISALLCQTAILTLLLVESSFSATIDAGNIVNIADYGARPEKNFDSTEAIQKAMAVAKETGRTVYIPDGTWEYRSFLIDSVRLMGAGSDRTTLYAPDPEEQTIRLTGNKPALKDIRILIEPPRRDSENDAVQAHKADAFEISRIEVDGANAAGIMICANNGRVTNHLVF